MRDRMAAGEARKPVNTFGVSRGVANVQATRIKGVAGQQDSRPPIVKRNARRLMARNRNNIEHAVAEIDRADVGRPMRNPEEGADRRSIAADHFRTGTTHKLAIAGDVIAVRMTVRDDETEGALSAARQDVPNQRID